MSVLHCVPYSLNNVPFMASCGHSLSFDQMVTGCLPCYLPFMGSKGPFAQSLFGNCTHWEYGEAAAILLVGKKILNGSFPTRTLNSRMGDCATAGLCKAWAQCKGWMSRRLFYSSIQISCILINMVT